MSTLRRIWFNSSALLAVLATCVQLPPATAKVAKGTELLEGWLTAIWADPPPPASPPPPRYYLSSNDGQTTELLLAKGIDHGALRSRLLQRVTVEVHGRRILASGRFEADFAALVPDPVPTPLAPVLGSRPWITLLCKFADIADEPIDLAYAQAIYTASPDGLDAYWQQISYGSIDLAGSTAHNWVVLPRTFEEYFGDNYNLGLLFQECGSAAEADGVDFSLPGAAGYDGINMAFNAFLPPNGAWGGGSFATLSGISKVWRATWLGAGWGQTHYVTVHEMGHAFGRPHSTNWDGDGDPYDNPWDVMSHFLLSPVSAAYGTVGQHMIAHHKEALGWLDPSSIFEPPADGAYSVQLRYLGAATSSGHHEIRVDNPLTGRSWTLEARGPTDYYDGAFPASAVFAYEIDETRPEPAWLYDSEIPPADSADNEGSILRVGEVFQDRTMDLQVLVDAETLDGFELRLRLGESNLLPVLDVAVVGYGLGSVQSDPAGISCGDDCQEEYGAGQVVQLTATPQPFATFDGWTGDADCADGQVTMSSPVDCVATFTAVPRELTVEKLGSGSGLVGSSPAGIDCGSDCSELFAHGTQVSLFRFPDSGSGFTGWSGDPDCVDGVLGMQSDLHCIANFTNETRHLEIQRVGAGLGRLVSGYAPGIDCGTDCNEDYVIGAEVDLHGIAEPGSTFIGLEGPTCNATASEDSWIIQMNSDSICLARFYRPTLNLTKTGPGSGTVTSSPPGISCGSSCSSGFNEGQLVRLTAEPATGSEFSGWSGDADCGDSVVAMDADKECTAEFSPCSIAEAVEVTDVMLSGASTHQACNVLTVGPGVVLKPTAQVTFRAGNQVLLLAPVSVEAGAHMEVRIGPD